MRGALRVLLSTVALVMLASACGETDPNSTAYWIQKLDGKERKHAIMRLGDMKAAEAVEPLSKIYEGGGYRYEIVAALNQIGDKKAIPVLLEAFKNTSDPKTSRLAANTLREWEVSEHADVYLDVLKGKKTPKEARYAALELINAFPDKKAISTLLTILSEDPDVQPIAFNGLAAEALGKLGASEAVAGLISCLWLDDHLHRNEVPRCRLALNRIGPKAVVPMLLKTLQRKNLSVERRAHKLRFGKGGLIEAKCAELLGDMPDPASVEPLLKALTHFDEMPPEIQQDPNKNQAFVMAEVQKVISVANALAVIGDKRAVKDLIEIAEDKTAALEYKLTSIQQLAFLGSQKAVSRMFKLLKHEPHPADPVSQGFRLQIALNLANLLDGADAKAVNRLQKRVKEIQDKMRGWAKQVEAKMADAPTKGRKASLARDLKAYNGWLTNYDAVHQKVDALRKCQSDVACWGQMLASKKGPVRMLAGYRIAQMAEAKDTAVKTLLPYVGDKNLVFRNVVLFAIDRLGDASVVPALEKARAADAERAKKDKNYTGAVYTMDLSIAKMKHRK